MVSIEEFYVIASGGVLPPEAIFVSAGDSFVAKIKCAPRNDI